MNRIRRLPLAFLAATVVVTPALAAWPNQSALNLPVCTGFISLDYPTIVSDGAGGAIVAWQDARDGYYDIYAQHLLASGTVDPAWPSNGRALCTAGNQQARPTIVSDGAGGAIVTWSDDRSGNFDSGNSDIYAQHVLASGAVDPAWPLDGRALCTAAHSQQWQTIVSDGAGGAIVTWHDNRSGTPGIYSPISDIYAQHVLASGAVDPAWPVDGRALCTAANVQSFPMIVSDGAGGAIVTWQDARSGTYDIYAQHVMASGALDPSWTLDGRALCSATSDQYRQTIVGDGAGGAIVTWVDFRNGSTGDIYAQHVLALGFVDSAWPVGGRGLCTAAGTQDRPTIVSDGSGGAIVTWDDTRSGSFSDIYAQHVLASGAVDPAWPLDGRALCSATSSQFTPTIVSDGAGGAIVTWSDYRSGVTDIYAQHVLASGAVDSVWPVDGRAMCTATGRQFEPTIVSDGEGGAIVTWCDSRSGYTNIYAQRVARFGYLGTPEAEMAGVKDLPNDNGGKVKVSWTASYLDLAQDANLAAYDVLRSVPPNVAEMRLARGERLASSLSELGNIHSMITLPSAAQGYFWELLASVNALHYVSGYSMLASTAFDSLGAGNPKTAFMVVARNSSGSMFWPSRPDSGYSVDNLPPAAPAALTGQYAAGTTTLHWNRNTEPDLAGYRLYRGSSVAFVPGPSNLVSALPDIGAVDAAGAPYVYKLTAVDSHGNESPVATLVPTGTTGVGDGMDPSELALSPASPNPASRGTTLWFSLPVGARVSLGLYDAAGRLVREITRGSLPAGDHAATWDLRDGNGRTVGAGLYFARLEVGGRTLVRRVAVTR